MLGQQVLGGHGYIAEWGLEQNVRDARISQIYEGANGIQALDLMGRKTVRNNGKLLGILFKEMEGFIASNKDIEALAEGLTKLESLMGELKQATNTVIENAKDNPDEIGAASYPYMELMGLTLFCFMWQRIFASVHLVKANNDSSENYLNGLLGSGEFFMNRLLPKSKTLLEEIEAGSKSLMAIPADQF